MMSWLRNPLRHLPALAAAVALSLSGLGQSASYLHLLTVKHEVCAAHGEVADAAADGVGIDEAGNPLETSGAPALARSETAGHGDHHCLAAAGRREKGLCTGSAAPATTLLSCDAVSSAEARAPRASKRPVYRLAPKHSPPLV